MIVFRLFLGLFILLLQPMDSWAREVMAVVTKVKGNATILHMGNKKAHEVKVGTKVYLQSSISTEKSSFVRIKLANETKLLIKPESHLVLDQTHLKSGIKVSAINVFTGALRAHVVNKDKKNDKNFKMLLKTKTMAMGVRGTEFELIHRPQSNGSSLLTYEGNVEISTFEKSDTLRPIAKVVEEKQRSSILAGQIGRGEEKKEIIVKEMNAKQFHALEESGRLSQEPAKLMSPLPSSGGVYLDAATGTLVPDSIGSADPVTGEYEAPEGMVLTAQNGFVAQNPEKQEEAQELNEKTKQLATTQSVAELPSIKPSKLRVSGGVATSAKSLEISSSLRNMSGEIYSKFAPKGTLQISYDLLDWLELFAGLEGENVEYDEPVGINHTHLSDESYIQYFAGAEYRPLSFLGFGFQLRKEQDLFVEVFEDSTLGFSSRFHKYSVLRQFVYAKLYFNRLGKHRFDALAGYIRGENNRDELVSVSASNGGKGSFKYSYCFRDNQCLGSEFSHFIEKSTLGADIRHDRQYSSANLFYEHGF